MSGKILLKRLEKVEQICTPGINMIEFDDGTEACEERIRQRQLEADAIGAQLIVVSWEWSAAGE